MFRPFQGQISGSMACSRYRDNTPIGFLSDFRPGSVFYTKILPPDSAPNLILRSKKSKKNFFLITPPPFPIPYFRIGKIDGWQLISKFRPFQGQMSGSMACSRYRDNTPIGFLSDFGPGSRFYPKILPPDSAPNPYSEVKKFEKKNFF